MVSGQAPPIFGGIGDSTHQLLLEMAELRPEWRWLWLSRRPRWYSSPATSMGPISMLRPAFGWDRTGIALSESLARLCRPHLVHVQDEEFSYFHTNAACRIAAAARAPLVSTLHEYHLDGPGVNHTAELAKRSDVVITNDRRTAGRCLEHTGREPDHVFWSANTIPPPCLGPSFRREPGLVTTFGFVNALKQLDVAYQGLSLLRERRPDLRWEIVGPFEPSHRADHAELARRMSADWVTFTGGLPEAELRDRLAKSRLMILPFVDGASTRRGTLQVAWAFGMPVVTTPPTIDDARIVDGWNCRLVGESTPEAWANAVGQILDDPSLDRGLCEGSLATAEQFSVRRQAALHIEIYENLLGKLAPREQLAAR